MIKYILILFCSLSFSQASNQMITFTAAQSLGFALNVGQSSVTSNQCMTKNDALTKYNLSSSAMDAYTSNQLVPRSSWVTGVVNSVSFSSVYRVYNTQGTSYANGTLTVIGDPININAYSYSSTGSIVNTTTVVNGVSQTANTPPGTVGYTASTSFLLNAGVYAYSVTYYQPDIQTANGGINYFY